MTTRKITFYLSLVLLLCVGVVHAGEFSMSSGSLLSPVSAPAERDVAIEAAAPTRSGADSSSRFMSGAGVAPTSHTEMRASSEPGLDSVSAAPSKVDNNARVGAPAAPVLPNRARAGNRWQSLVPGAIK